MSDDEAGLDARAADRLIFFSDAVVAIAITLLAIDLPVPAGASMSAFWSSVKEHDENYLAFSISFIVIALAWRHHHTVLRSVVRIDPRLITYNLIWLLTIVLNPFATKLLTFDGHDSVGTHALRFGFYSLLQVLAAAALLSMVHHIASHNLQAAETPQRALSDADWDSASLMLGFGLSIPIFFLTTSAWVVWIAAPLVTRGLRRHYRRRRAVEEVT